MFAPPELGPGDFPPPHDAVSITLPTRAHAITVDKTRRAFLKLPTNTKPAMPNEKIQLAYISPPVRPGRFFAVVGAFVIFSVEVAFPLPGLMVAGENEQSRFAGR